MKQSSIAFIGGGRITNIFLRGFKQAGITFSSVSVFDPSTQSLEKLAADFPLISVENDSPELVAVQDIVILAVHPPVLTETLQKIKPALKSGSLVISLAPKITFEKISGILGSAQAVARANPGAAGIINKGINPVSFNSACTPVQREYTTSLLSSLGQVRLVDEKKMEAYAVISAMGPTYFWFQLQVLKDLALEFGMDEAEAREVISSMMAGAVDTLFASGMEPEAVMNLVPVKPLGEHEAMIRQLYREKLTAVFEKIKP